MSAPRTPQKSRTHTTPPRPLTPGVPRVKGATASPQVRAALAALRKSRHASASSPSPADAHLEWSVKEEGKLIEAASKSGRLNLASRNLSAIPPLVYSALLPRSSTYHPSNRNPSQYRREPQPDLTLAVDGGEERAAAWYEQQDLRTLNLANNELESVGDELGGFEELEILDLHNNLLSTIPASVGYLVHLTSLSLAHNRLVAFPTQILNLRHLRELSLAHNQLTHLWAKDWRAQLEGVLPAPEASPSATPESASGREESFWDSFPSSPFKRTATDASTSTAPFPFLTSFSAAANPLSTEALTLPGFELPPRLVALDLSACGLSDSAVPPVALGTLSALKELDLSANELSDKLFSTSIFPVPASPARLFPSLETLCLSLNPLDSLESPEVFLASSVGRPVSYIGLPHIIENLVRNEERRTGRRIGVPDGAGDLKELRVLVRECPLRAEQQRRRARFPATASSASRAPPAVAAPVPAPAAVTAEGAAAGRSQSPSPPPSPSPAPVATPGTPARRRPVVLETWEVEAAAGLSTPGARRRAAALQAQRERAEAAARRAEEEERARAGREEEEQEEMTRRLREVKVGEKDKEKDACALQHEEEQPTSPRRERSEQGSPPPYSPRTPPPAVPTPSLRAPPPVPTRTAAPVEAEREADPTDPAIELVSSAFARSQAKSTVVLSGRGLAALPVPTSGAVPRALSAPSHADFSRNALPFVPLPALTAWGWAASLRVLNLANNRLAALEVLAAMPADGGALFPSLDALDLSGNFLPSHVTSPFPPSSPTSTLAVAEDGTVPLLGALAALCPALSTLSLRGNRLTTLSGVGALLLPSTDAPLGVRGIRRLDLAENRLRSADDLVAVAERFERGERAAWRCDELDLSMNDVAA
ncbi:hypothetical protein JCM3770_001565, partial [Rhodotorula araucariae]